MHNYRAFPKSLDFWPIILNASITHINTSMLPEFIELLDEHLAYHDHEIHEDYIDIFVHSKRESVSCSFCGQISSRIHSRYPRCFSDLPILGKKVNIHLLNRNYLCLNPDCKHTTFAETFDCIDSNSKKSKRLLAEIQRVSVEVSSVTAAKLLSDGVVDIGKSTICNLLQKNNKFGG